MKVGLAVDALSPELTGVGRYCWELASRLPQVADIQAVSFWRGNDEVTDPGILLRGGNPSRLRKPWLVRRLHRLGLRTGLRSPTADWPSMDGIDLFHSPNFMLPRWVERGIATIHDLSVLRYPETHPPARIAAFERDFSESLDRCTHIITPSCTVRDEVVEHTGFAADRVTAVAMGVGSHFVPVSAELRHPVLARLGLPAMGYGLTIAALEPRKRIDRLIAAWGELPRDLRRRFPLVVAGASGWENDNLRDTIERAAREGWLIPLGYLAESDLPALYSGASLFVYPSLYEGFGLPPIEAMACGVPVIVANASCLPEVTAGAAMLVDPDNIAEFSVALERGLTDNIWRGNAIPKGLDLAGRYSWSRCISSTIDVYGASIKA